MAKPNHKAGNSGRPCPKYLEHLLGRSCCLANMCALCSHVQNKATYSRPVHIWSRSIWWMPFGPHQNSSTRYFAEISVFTCLQYHEGSTEFFSPPATCSAIDCPTAACREFTSLHKGSWLLLWEKNVFVGWDSSWSDSSQWVSCSFEEKCSDRELVMCANGWGKKKYVDCFVHWAVTSVCHHTFFSRYLRKWCEAETGKLRLKHGQYFDSLSRQVQLMKFPYIHDTRKNWCFNLLVLNLECLMSWRSQPWVCWVSTSIRIGLRMIIGIYIKSWER